MKIAKSLLTKQAEDFVNRQAQEAIMLKRNGASYGAVGLNEEDRDYYRKHCGPIHDFAGTIMVSEQKKLQTAQDQVKIQLICLFVLIV